MATTLLRRRTFVIEHHGFLYKYTETIEELGEKNLELIDLSEEAPVTAAAAMDDDRFLADITSSGDSSSQEEFSSDVTIETSARRDSINNNYPEISSENTSEEQTPTN